MSDEVEVRDPGLITYRILLGGAETFRSSVDISGTISIANPSVSLPSREVSRSLLDRLAEMRSLGNL